MQQWMLRLLDMEAAPPQSSSKQQQLMRTVSISILVMSLPVLYVSFLHVPPAALVRDTTFWFLMSNSIIIVIAADSGMLFFRSSSSSSCSVYDDDGGSILPFVVAEPPPVLITKNVHALPSMGGEVAPPPVPAEPPQRDLTAIAENEAAYALVVVREDDGQAWGRQPERKNAIVAAPSAADYAAARPRLTMSRSVAREERRKRRPSRSSDSHALVPVHAQDKSVVAVAGDDDDETRLRGTAAEESEYERLSDEELNRRVEEFIARFNREMRLQLEKDDQLSDY